MFNPFPELLDFSFLTIAILRIVVGFLYVSIGLAMFTSHKKQSLEFFGSAGMTPATFWLYIVGGIQLIGGALLFVGAFTQLSVIPLALVTLGALYFKLRGNVHLHNQPAYYFLLFIITLSFLFLGAGPFAFDLPL